MEMYIIITISILIFLLILVILGSYFAYCYTFKRRKSDISPYHNLDGEDPNGVKASSRALIDEFLKISPTKEVQINSYDGLKLRAKLYIQDENAPFELAFHGYRSLSVRDFSAGAQESFKRGHNLLLVDARAHGRSEGKTISFGIKERYDVLSWVKYLALEYPCSKVILLGLSMGAATVLMASELPLTSVRAIIADCPYSSPADIIKKVARDFHVPSFIAYPLVRLGGVLFGDFDIEQSSPRDAVKRAKIPIMIIHGESDKFVPVDMSREILKGNENITIHTFPNATHGTSFIYDSERYIKITNEFIEKSLNKEREDSDD